jgi:3-hydroxyisobutyrate dehydrogenase
LSRVAVLGTGIMGAPMARNLARAGHELRVWNRTAAKARALEADGATVAAGPREAADGAQVVVTMLADGAAVDAVAAEALAAGPEWWQASTVGIAATERHARLADERGVAFVDAPVLGTRAPAEQGALTVLASGPDDAVATCTPLFEVVGAQTVRLGDAGEATRLKLVLNHWLLGLVESLAETIAFAEAAGVEPRTFLRTISGGPIGPAYADAKGAMMIERDFPASFPLRLAAKDAGIVLEAAQRHGIELGLMPVIRERLERAIGRGHGDDDMAAAIYGTTPDGGPRP